MIKELIVIKVLNEKNTIMESKPKSRTDKQKKALQACNNKLRKISKELVEDVLRKFPHLQKKTDTERFESFTWVFRFLFSQIRLQTS